jgi:hypothetical protein
MKGASEGRRNVAEIAKGLKLIKVEQDFNKNFEVLDQINSYSVQSKLDKPVDITVNITGSDGATFTGPIDSRSLTKTTTVPAHGKAEVG